MRLTDQEKAMLDGAEGPAKQKAMDLLVRYGEALGAESFVDVTNIAGVPGSSTMFLHEYYKEHGGGSFEDVFSRFDLDSDETVPFPKVGGNCCHLQGGMDPNLWAEQGMSREALEHQQQDEAELIRHGVKLLKTCTPYLAGNMPALRRALRVDGIVRRGLLQLGGRRAHQHRRPREHQRRHDHRQDPRLGFPSR